MVRSPISSTYTCIVTFTFYTSRAHKRIIGNYLASGNKRTRSEKVLVLFVESGVLYSSLWVRHRLTDPFLLKDLLTISIPQIVVMVGLAISAPIMGKYLQTTGLIQLVVREPSPSILSI